MERLTRRKEDGSVYCRIEKGNSFIGRMAAIEDILGDDYDLDRLRDLLEACKGLEPGEIAESKLLIATRKDPKKLARMAELVTADRDGRCVVFKFGIGATAYRAWVCYDGSHPFVSEEKMDTVQDLVKAETWLNAYTTREAAEAALRGN